MTHFSLCSGIGGLDLAAEWAGFTTIAQCEINEYASKVLAKNFPGVPNLHDIRTVTTKRLAELGIDPRGITVISAGFPCQPYSLAGKGRGDRDERDLWGEVARVLGELKPRWFVGENTPGLFSRDNQRYFRRILSDLIALGYRVGWGIWGACDVGAPHKRQRVFLMAYSNGERWKKDMGQPAKTIARFSHSTTQKSCGSSRVLRNVPNTMRKRGVDEKMETDSTDRREQAFSDSLELCGNVPVPGSKWETQRRLGELRGIEEIETGRGNLRGGEPLDGCGEWWRVESDVGRVAHGIPARVERLTALGNAVVPAQAYPIFKAIADFELR